MVQLPLLNVYSIGVAKWRPPDSVGLLGRIKFTTYCLALLLGEILLIT